MKKLVALLFVCANSVFAAAPSFVPSNPTLNSPTLISPTLITPVLGTPASGVITNCTGGPTLTSATLITPALGTPASGVLTSCTGLTPANITAGSISSVNLLANPFRQRMSGDVTNATATFSNLTGISCNLLAGRKYTGKLIIKCNNSTAAEGIKLDFAGGTATVSEFWAATAQIVGGTDVLGTSISTSLAGVINFTTITGETILETNFSFICTASTGAGTFIPRTAENSHTTGTLTTEKGSFLWLEDMP